ncbi:MAG: LysE family translocator [Rickettsiales bacterium]|nr:LysE family translocator [Rickettsiales bacterium]
MSIYNFLELGITYLLAAMMPGPSLALIIKNALVNSRMASIKASLGTIVGTALQSASILISLNFIENNSIFFKILQVLCSAYLIYLGTKILFAKKLVSKKASQQLIIINKENYFLEALLIEFLNPLAFAFFISIMSIFVNQQESWEIKLICWLEIVSLSFIWFFLVSWIISLEKVTFYTKNFNKILETSAGCVFILFGIKMFIY